MLITILPSLVNIRLPLKGSVCVKPGPFKVGVIKMHISITRRVQWLGAVCHQISVKPCAGDDAKAEPKTILQTILAVSKDNCHVGRLQGFTEVPELANQSALAQNLSSFGNTQFVTKALTSRLQVAQLTENFPLHSNFWGWRKYSDHKTKLPFFCKWLSNICSLLL